MALTKDDKKYIETTISNKLNQKLDEQELRFENKLTDIELKFEDKLTEFKSEFFEKIDPILKEVTAGREERTLQASQISDHEDRIEKLENIHPKGRHLASI